MIVRGLVIVVLLAAALTAGLLAYSKDGRSQGPSATCTVANCDSSLPGGWPGDPNRQP